MGNNPNAGKWFDLKATHFSLSLARIVFFSFQFCEFAQTYWNRAISFPEGSLIGNVVLPVYLVIHLLLIFGLFTRFALIANLILARVILDNVLDIYHVDYVIKYLSLALVFMPEPKALALDLVRRKEKARPGAPLPTWFYLWVFTPLALTYFDSLFFKYRNEIWQNGLAFWMPAALPNFSTGYYPEFLEVKALVMPLSYLSLIYETLFPALLLRRGRLIVWTVGVGFHLGIAMFFPIPWFALSWVGALLLFFPFHWFMDLEDDGEPQESLAYSKVVARLGYAGCVLLFLFQLSLIFTPNKVNRFIALHIGQARHNVYLDFHFTLTSPILRFYEVTEEERIPIASFDDKGYPQVSGRYWATTHFFLRFGFLNDPPKYTMWHIARYCKGSLLKRGRPVAGSVIEIEYKDVTTPLALDFDRDDQIEKHPWHAAGRIVYDENGKANFDFTRNFRHQMFDVRRPLPVRSKIVTPKKEEPKPESEPTTSEQNQNP
ncbi:HTTM domain-containing protein [Sulfidibacter corallicola]|uniref:HTTM domain-containing protein n=1 Tax=Sulfidibacter corallicola TaxID=2818388 RepID=A0A8A4TXT6_SULCO|nr:HTTM domain-containing protein [Sulfidibacter corallicola]QTD54310.1 HTTM domain-containing protein [Sulfidibacter corallicola]